MMPHKKWVISFILLVFSCVGMVGAINFIVDPYQLYRADEIFNTNQRYANVGLAKHHDYDSIIIGSSETENFSPRYINERFGSNIIKLCVSGATSYEENLTADLALRTNKVRFVIWGLDYPSFRGEPDRLGSYETPVYLYDDDPLNDIKYAKYLMCMETLKLSSKKLSVKLLGKEKNQFSKDRENLYNWYEDEKDGFTYGHYKKSWEISRARRAEGAPDDLREYDLELMKKSFDANLLSLVESNPDVLFYIFYPPYSALFHYDYYLASKDVFRGVLAFKRYVFDRLARFPNVKLYDFQAALDITGDISLYKDLHHYNPGINRYIIDSIASDRYLVTSDNVDEYIGLLKKSTEKLDVDSVLKAP